MSAHLSAGQIKADYVYLALVRATSFAVLAHVVALDGAHHDHWPLGATAGGATG